MARYAFSQSGFGSIKYSYSIFHIPESWCRAAQEGVSLGKLGRTPQVSQTAVQLFTAVECLQTTAQGHHWCGRPRHFRSIWLVCGASSLRDDYNQNYGHWELWCSTVRTIQTGIMTPCSRTISTWSSSNNQLWYRAQLSSTVKDIGAGAAVVSWIWFWLKTCVGPLGSGHPFRTPRVIDFQWSILMVFTPVLPFMLNEIGFVR